MQRITKPKGSKGSIRHRSLEGDGTNDINSGTYARNNPSGGRMPSSIHFMATPMLRFAPAESPVRVNTNSNH